LWGNFFYGGCKSGIKSIIDVKELNVRYPDGSLALQGVNFDIQEGEHCAVVGANGAGKSTLLSTFAGLLPVENGSAALGGLTLNPKNFKDIRKMIGFVFQNPDEQLFMPRLYDDIAFGLRNTGYP
jgi:cobalt/nickel transport system ATP-binding protein